jgi:glycosyltransferase involved in cell wall biosynthesis
MLIELILPAHNEAKSIGPTIEGFLAASESASYELRVLVAEDGSIDDTREVVERLSAEHPCQVRITPPCGRKGYSKAMIDAIPATAAEVVAFCDSDGQFDPGELGKLVAELSRGTVVAGLRSPRVDSAFRILASKTFGFVYRMVIGLRMADPSSPFVVVHRDDVLRFNPERTHLSCGFWWEFFARANAAGLAIREVPVNHRIRYDGKTQVYRLYKLPRIAITHLRGLVELRRELQAVPQISQPLGETVVE